VGRYDKKKTWWHRMEDRIGKYELWIGKAGELDGLNGQQTPKKKKKNGNYKLLRFLLYFM